MTRSLSRSWFPAFVVLTFPGLTFLAACGGDTSSGPEPDPEPPTVASVTVTAPADEVAATETLQLTATVRDGSGNVLTGRSVAWSSSDPTLAEVDQSGLVSGGSPGSVTITAESEGVGGTKSLEVTPAPLASLELVLADPSVPVGESLAIEAVLTDAQGNVVTDGEVEWRSGDPERAAVSAEGVVTGLLPGPSTITATAEGLSASVEVGVYRPGFVTRLGRRFMLDGEPFYVGGANSQVMLADGQRWEHVIQSALGYAQQLGVRVLRIWGSSEIGSFDESVPSLGQYHDARPVYQYWDAEAGRPAYNDGPDGLEILDHAIAEAGRVGIRLTINLVDNWDWYWGGANQYLIWYGLENHGDFWTDGRVRQAYRDWVSHLLNRTNTITGVRYADDPTIMAWELANEASCYGGESFAQGSCHRSDIEAWIEEMAAHVRSIDTNHLIAVGDQGHFSDREGEGMGWAYRSPNEPDFETVMRMADIDYGTYHAYPHDSSDPEVSLPPTEYGLHYIRDREAVAREVGKPAIFEEFGSRNYSVQSGAFDAWLEALYEEGGAGFMFYQVGARLPDGSRVWGEEGDGYDIFPDSPSAPTLVHWVQRFNEREE